MPCHALPLPALGGWRLETSPPWEPVEAHGIPPGLKTRDSREALTGCVVLGLSPALARQPTLA